MDKASPKQTRLGKTMISVTTNMSVKRNGVKSFVSRIVEDKTAHMYSGSIWNLLEKPTRNHSNLRGHMLRVVVFGSRALGLVLWVSCDAACPGGCGPPSDEQHDVFAGRRAVQDAVLLSDLHLGAESCQVGLIQEFIHSLPSTERLILNGDVLENTESRLTKHHWR